MWLFVMGAGFESQRAGLRVDAPAVALVRQRVPGHRDAGQGQRRMVVINPAPKAAEGEPDAGAVGDGQVGETHVLDARRR